MTWTGGTPPWGTPPQARPYGEPGHSWAPEPPHGEELTPDDGPTVVLTRPEPSSAVLALVLGVVGLFVFPPLAPAAWIVGRREVRAVDAGRRDPRGRGAAQAAVVLGVVGTVVLVLGVLAVVLVVSLFAAAVGALLNL